MRFDDALMMHQPNVNLTSSNTFACHFLSSNGAGVKTSYYIIKVEMFIRVIGLISGHSFSVQNWVDIHTFNLFLKSGQVGFSYNAG